VEAVEYFLLPFSAPYKVSLFRVCFRFQLLSSKCFRFHKKLTASTASVSLFMFYEKTLPLPAPQKVTLPASFFKVLPLPKKFNRFHISGCGNVV